MLILFYENWYHNRCLPCPGIIFCSAPPLVSAAWFPPNERVTATSIGGDQRIDAFTKPITRADIQRSGGRSGIPHCQTHGDQAVFLNISCNLQVQSKPPNDNSVITEKNATQVYFQSYSYLSICIDLFSFQVTQGEIIFFQHELNNYVLLLAGPCLLLFLLVCKL